MSKSKKLSNMTKNDATLILVSETIELLSYKDKYSFHFTSLDLLKSCYVLIHKGKTAYISYALSIYQTVIRLLTEIEDESILSGLNEIKNDMKKQWYFEPHIKPYI